MAPNPRYLIQFAFIDRNDGCDPSTGGDTNHKHYFIPKKQNLQKKASFPSKKLSCEINRANKQHPVQNLAVISYTCTCKPLCACVPLCINFVENRKYIKMVYNFKVFKKCAPNGKVTLYMGKRDFVDHVSGVEPIDGIVVLDDEYIRDNRKVFGQIVCSFRYGREEDEVMGLNFQKELCLASEQIYPRPEKSDKEQTKLQERLLKKLGSNAIPFTFNISPNAPSSVTLQQGEDDNGDPCGVSYYVKIFAGESETDRTHRRSTVTLGIRKIQFAPTKQGQQPCTLVRKDFMLSPGELELEVTLDKQLYLHGERIGVNICIRNNSNKMVKKIKAMVQQGVDVVLFQNGSYRNTVASLETSEGCPIQPGSSLQKVMYLTPLLSSNKQRRGIALDGQIKRQDQCLASTTLLAQPDQRDAFGVIISYAVKVKLFLGALGGELSAELPFVLMHPKPGTKAKVIHADSQADVETFRQDTIDQQASVDFE